MQKIGFPLQSDGEWPPFDVEYLWAKPVPRGYQIKNSPFFVKGIAFDDVINANISDDSIAENWKLLLESGNSTAWIFVRRKRSDVIERLLDCGCMIEGEPIRNLYSATILRSTNIRTIDEILAPYKKKRAISIAFPAFRHADA